MKVYAYKKLVINSKTSHQSSLKKLSCKQVDQSTHPTQVHPTEQEFTLYTGKQKRQRRQLCVMAVNVSYLKSIYTHHILTADDGEVLVLVLVLVTRTFTSLQTECMILMRLLFT